MFENHEPIRVNFVDANEEKRTRRHTVVLAVVFAVIVGAVASLAAFASYRAAVQGTGFLAELGRAPVIADIRQLFGGSDTTDPTKNERMNILFLGIGGEGHEGGSLTDTILLASLDLKNNRVGLLSIPRDLAYPLGEGKFEKINSVHAYAEQDHPGEGAVRTSEAIGKLLGVEIQHVIRLDFKGFVAFVNAIGGIDVTVERNFTDPQYPAPEDKWTSISFKQGLQHMDGATTLVYVRSRHGNNGEGSDFARSRRQQIVLTAIRNKVLSLGTLANPTKIAGIYSAISNNLQTDLSPWDVLKLAPLASQFSQDKITNHVLTDAPNGELTAANVNGAYMLFPKQPDWSVIRDIAQNPFAETTTSTAAVPVINLTHIEIKNGTTRTGFAAQVAALLEKDNFEITAFGNAVRRGYERSMIFDLTGGKKSAELSQLRKRLNADVSTSLPSWIKSDTGTSSRVVYGDGLAAERILSPNSDFLIILGESSAGLLR